MTDKRPTSAERHMQALRRLLARSIVLHTTEVAALRWAIAQLEALRATTLRGTADNV